ncbi:lipoyl(octanoyl) transferase LipB [Hydrogenimonas sp.]
MILHRWDLVPYLEARERMDALHRLAVEDGRNHLIFCEHPPCYTVGSEGGAWGGEVIPTDRGGSVTCHAPGQLVAYFCFQAPKPALFYRRVVRAYDRFFARTLSEARYEAKNPGWYLPGRKVASLGFRYRRGVSLHGVALNVDVDLDFCNRIAPCGLAGVVATSLAREGVAMTMGRVQELLLGELVESFEEEVHGE